LGNSREIKSEVVIRQFFDTVGNRSVTEYKRALKPQGHFVTTAFLPSLEFRGPWLSLTEGKKMVNMMAKPNQQDLDVLRQILLAFLSYLPSRIT
jgi:hypothetical protein